MREGEVDDAKPHELGVANGVRRAARPFDQIADAYRAVIDQTAVALVHTAAVVAFRGVDELIGFEKDLFIRFDVFLIPSLWLIFAGEDEDEPDVGMSFSQLDDGQRRYRVEAQRAACAEVAYALGDEAEEGFFEAGLEGFPVFYGNHSVAGEAAGLVSHLHSIIAVVYKLHFLSIIL